LPIHGAIKFMILVGLLTGHADLNQHLYIRAYARTPAVSSSISSSNHCSVQCYNVYIFLERTLLDAVLLRWVGYFERLDVSVSLKTNLSVNTGYT